MRIIYTYVAQKEKKIFEKLKSNLRLNLNDYFVIFIKSLVSIIESLIRNISGPIGFKLRELYYRSIFKKSGKNIFIDTNVIIEYPQNLELGSNIWIGSFSYIAPFIDNYVFKNNIHINTGCHIGGRAQIIFEDNVNISSGVKIFSGSASITSRNNNINNPMMKEDLSLIEYGKIHLNENSTVFANCTLAPSITMSKGSVLLPNSFLNKDTTAYEIYSGSPARKVGIRYS